MANAPHDQNTVKAKLGVWCVDGKTLITIKINPLTGEIKTDTTSVISYVPVPIDPRDENFQFCWLFQGQDGLTYPANVNSDGHLLVSIT